VIRLRESSEQNVYSPVLNTRKYSESQSYNKLFFNQNVEFSKIN